MRLKRVFLGVSLLLILAGGYMYFAHFRPIPPHEPTGEYAIGTTSFNFEFQRKRAGATRKIAVRAWYPSNAAEGTLGLVSSQKLVDKVVAFYQMPDVMATTEISRSYIDAAMDSLKAMSRAVEAAREADDFGTYWQAMRTLAQGRPFANMQPIMRDWIADTNALVNAIAEGETSQFPALFSAQMDAGKIGIFGHSLGGMAAIAASMGNENIKAVVNLDGPFAFDAPTEYISLPVPTCMLMAGGFAAGGEVISTSDINTPLFARAAQGARAC